MASHFRFSPQSSSRLRRVIPNNSFSAIIILKFLINNILTFIIGVGNFKTISIIREISSQENKSLFFCYSVYYSVFPPFLLGVVRREAIANQ